MPVTFTKDKLTIHVSEDRGALGRLAAGDIAACIRKLLKEKDEINMIFAAAPSQNETLAALAEEKDIPWERINAFHMDEYVGLAEDAPQRFSRYLTEHLFSLVPFKAVWLIDGSAGAEAEIARYSALLEQYPVDIVCMGIGENGHIAFNDPHEADFNDPAAVKTVSLDEVCRMQQVHDGCFASLDEVPTHALTLTVPALARAPYHFCMVPAKSKAWAVRETVTAEIGAHCPATVLRNLPDSVLYCDRDSGALLEEAQ